MNGNRWWWLLVFAVLALSMTALGGTVLLLSMEVKVPDTLILIASNGLSGLVGAIAAPRSSMRATDTPAPAPEVPHA